MKQADLKYITSDGRSLDERVVLDRCHYKQNPPLRDVSVYRCFGCDKIITAKDGFFSSETAQEALSKHVREHSSAGLLLGDGGSSTSASKSAYTPRPHPKNYNANPSTRDVLSGLFLK
ncbi:hypothetical protein FHL15_007388 [Xylaria flabelliformis]|uniref:Uncharacterized protein n=1 Tax=Xylaria flabelliformis TaxID=2512241 RepID=A0A553HV59_9PEZI|nr:hypothetical protein FHL15_007388 [Xylaria flabelliformis]